MEPIIKRKYHPANLAKLLSETCDLEALMVLDGWWTLLNKEYEDIMLIVAYNDTELKKFDGVYRQSKLLGLIDKSDIEDTPVVKFITEPLLFLVTTSPIELTPKITFPWLDDDGNEYCLSNSI